MSALSGHAYCIGRCPLTWPLTMRSPWHASQRSCRDCSNWAGPTVKTWRSNTVGARAIPNVFVSELPGDRHGVSANASKTKPAKLLAVFVVDTNETELTIPFGN